MTHGVPGSNSKEKGVHLHAHKRFDGGISLFNGCPKLGVEILSPSSSALSNALYKLKLISNALGQRGRMLRFNHRRCDDLMRKDLFGLIGTICGMLSS